MRCTVNLSSDPAPAGRRCWQQSDRFVSCAYCCCTTNCKMHFSKRASGVFSIELCQSGMSFTSLQPHLWLALVSASLDMWPRHMRRWGMWVRRGCVSTTTTTTAKVKSVGACSFSHRRCCRHRPMGERRSRHSLPHRPLRCWVADPSYVRDCDAQVLFARGSAINPAAGHTHHSTRPVPFKFHLLKRGWC
jgi:hypothetical protein